MKEIKAIIGFSMIISLIGVVYSILKLIWNDGTTTGFYLKLLLTFVIIFCTMIFSFDLIESVEKKRNFEEKKDGSSEGK